MKVKDLMTSHVITVRPTQTLQEVAELLYQYHFTGVPVADEDGTLRGIIAERDFIASDSKLYLPTYIKLLTDMDFVQNDEKRLPPEARKIINARAKDIMNPKVVTVFEDTDIDDLAELFAEKRVNPVPVVDKKGKIIGIISRSDLIKLLSGKQRVKQAEVIASRRVIDTQVGLVEKDLNNRFAYVAKFRANVWLTTAIVLFIIGFLIGVVYVVDPNFFTTDNGDTYQYIDAGNP
jgi:CBS domain-containing protein